MPVDLSKARILISNDDGFYAPGIELLTRVVESMGAEVWVVAPAQEQSGAAHALTIHRPLRIKQLGERRYTVDGTPTDCVLLGVQEIMKGAKPDLILAGINRGGNLGEDVTYSGTASVAMEGALMGIHSIAFSQLFTDGEPVRWATAEGWTVKVLEALVNFELPETVFLNVNFPDVDADDVTGIEVVVQGQRKIGSHVVKAFDPRGNPYYWLGPQRIENANLAGTDLEAVHRGAISVTPLSTDLTHSYSMALMKAKLR